MKKLICLIVVVLLLSLSFTHEMVADESSSGYTIYVDDDNTNGPWDGSQEHPYQHIQDGIDTAIEWDTVFVYGGTYYENVAVDKSIDLIGEDRDTTIIDGGGSGNVVHVSSDRVIISGFKIQNTGASLSEMGIEIRSNYCTFSGNIISKNGCGVIIHSSNNNTISDNTITNNEFHGIYLWGSSDNTITGNTFISNICIGLALSNSNRNTITINSFFNDGISVTNSYQNTVEGNVVNGKPLVYLEEESNKIIENAGQIVLVNCDNITIQSQEFSNTDNCIELLNTDNCLISGNIFNSNNNNGIWLSHSSNNHISNNTVLADWYGIGLSYSSNNIIFGNTISNNAYIGLVIEGSDNNTVSDNIILNHNTGLQEAYSCDNIIFGNTISNNEVGIRLYGSSDSNITNNIIKSNENYEIYINGASDNKINYNIINDNKIYGSLALWYGNGNIITDNSFFDGGLLLSDSIGNTISNNTVNDKSLVYYEGVNFTDEIKNAGQVILVRCNKISIENQDLSNTSAGIQLSDTTRCNIRKNKISNNEFGIHILYNSEDNTISRNTISDNDKGIDSYYSENVNITGNIISKNNYGITFYRTEDSIIKGNHILSNKKIGILFNLATIPGLGCENNMVTYNIIQKNTVGIYLSDSPCNNINYNNFYQNIVDASFDFTGRNDWNHNYWNRPRILPKPVIGTMFYPFPFPWINFDWHPAKEPYDIPTGGA